MKKGLFALITLLMIPFLSISQNNGEITWSWTGTYGNGTDPSVANHLVLDDSANLYIAGVFRGELIIQTDTIWGNPNDDRVFVAKFDSSGGLKWLKKVDWGYFVNHIRLDSDNDLRVLCNSGIMIVYDGLDGFPLTYYNFPNAPDPDNFVVDFRLDSDDNMYVLSHFHDTQSWIQYSKVDVYSSPNDTISGSLWSRSIDLGVIGIAGPKALTIDSSRNVYVSGNTDFSDIVLTGNVFTSTPGPFFSLFTLKYDAQGDAMWINSIPIDAAEIFAMELNSTDSSLYMTGYSATPEVFNGDTLDVHTTNLQQIFLMKYDLDGNHQWAKPFPLATKTLNTFPNAPWGAMGTNLSVTDSGYVYMKGSFTGSIIFQNDTLVEDTSSVVLGQIADDVFITKLDMNGNPIWGKYAGNSGGVAYETGDFWVNPVTDILYLVGFWASPNNLKNSTPTNNVKGIFIGKEGVPNTLSINEIEADKYSLLIYPNPSDGIYFISRPKSTNDLDYEILNSQGNIVLSGKMKNSKEYIDLSNLSSGLYFFSTEFGSMKLLKN